VKSRLLQQRGGCSATQTGSDDGNFLSARHGALSFVFRESLVSVRRIMLIATLRF
jgi:hypothetical protein